MAAQKQQYIDAVRGWAILMVVITHAGDTFPELPYPVKKLTNFGWHGVQLFFLASAVTLLLSWHGGRQPDPARVAKFWLRRFLRIAPLYYLGALIYLVLRPPAAGFDPAQLLRTLCFINAWSPDWIPTTPGWTVVPGGWSIGVEFTFYLLFPLIAATVTSLARAWMLLAGALILACAANQAAASWLSAYPATAAANFLYFWFPNQAPVFAAGVVLFFLLRGAPARQFGRMLSYTLLLGIAGLLVVVAERPFGDARFTFTNPVPPILLATVGLAALVYVMARGADTLFTHPAICRIGVLSFSCYVLHFIFVRGLPAWSGGLIDPTATGVPAILSAGLLFALSLPLTLMAASVAHRMVEQPGMDLARRLTARPHTTAVTERA